MKTKEKKREVVGGSPDKLKDAAKAFEQLRAAEKQALDELKSAHAEVQRPALERAFKDMHKLQDVAMVQFMEILRDEIRDRDKRHDEAMEQFQESLHREIQDLRGRLETATLLVLVSSPLLASVHALVDAKKELQENGIGKFRQIGHAYTDFFKQAKESELQSDAMTCVADHSYYHNNRTSDLPKFLSEVFDIIDDLAVMCDFAAVNPPKRNVSKFFNGLQQLRERDAEFHPGYKEHDEKGFMAWFDIFIEWYRNDADKIKESLWQIDVANNQRLIKAKDTIISNIDQHLSPALDSLRGFRNALNNLLILAEAYNPIKE